MTTHTISSPGILFHQAAYGTRLLFEKGLTNPRDQLGKNGVTLHQGLSRFFYRTLTVSLLVKTPDGKETQQTLYINRNSLRKYLGKADVLMSDRELTEALTRAFYTSDDLDETNFQDKDAQTRAGNQGLRHAGRYNQAPLSHGLFKRAASAFKSWLYQKTIGSTFGIKIRFLFFGSEKALLETGEALAGQRFYQSLSDVPAYHAHLFTVNGVTVPPRCLTDVPVTSKSSYIIYNKDDDRKLHVNGLYPKHYKKDTSTGTTGKPAVWVRSDTEVQTVKKSLELAAKIQFGSRRLHYINAFALGQWATGLTTYELMRNTGSVFATGAQKQAILEELIAIKGYHDSVLDDAVRPMVIPESVERHAVKQWIKSCLDDALKQRDKPFAKVFEEQWKAQTPAFRTSLSSKKKALLSVASSLNEKNEQIVIAGYPPFLKDLSEHIKSHGHNVNEFNAIGVIGGQAISEGMRDLLMRDGFKQIYSSYGASDLDINLGVEADDEIVVRKAIEQHPGLARELFGDNKGTPMVFHYDTFNYHVECSNDNDLIYTCTRNDRSSPRVRYNLGDKGRVYASSDIQAALAKYGIFHTPRTNLPLMMVWGRDSTVVFKGANLSFTELERAITDLDLEETVLKKAFYSFTDPITHEEKTEVWLEVKEGVELSNDEQIQFSQSLVKTLAEINQDFRYQLSALDNDALTLSVRFFKRGKSPISEAGGHRKQVLVFNELNLPKEYHFPDAPDCSVKDVLNTEDLIRSKHVGLVR